MFQSINKSITAFFLLLALSATGVNAADQAATPEAPTPVGQVLMSIKTVIAKDANGQIRLLDRRSPIFAGDTLTTDDKGQVQLKMKDGAAMALGPNSEFTIKEYSYKASGDAADSAVLTLARGGLRSISGKISKPAYQLNTPTSTLGIRGTTTATVVKEDGSTTHTIEEGAGTVTGENGETVDLAAGETSSVGTDGDPSDASTAGDPDATNYFNSMDPQINNLDAAASDTGADAGAAAPLPAAPVTPPDPATALLNNPYVAIISAAIKNGEPLMAVLKRLIAASVGDVADIAAAAASFEPSLAPSIAAEAVAVAIPLTAPEARAEMVGSVALSVSEIVPALVIEIAAAVAAIAPEYATTVVAKLVQSGSFDSKSVDAVIDIINGDTGGGGDGGGGNDGGGEDPGPDASPG